MCLSEYAVEITVPLLDITLSIAFPDLVKYKTLIYIQPFRVDSFFRIPQVSPGAIISLRSEREFKLSRSARNESSTPVGVG
jgi:hypothetical protein